MDTKCFTIFVNKNTILCCLYREVICQTTPGNQVDNVSIPLVKFSLALLKRGDLYTVNSGSSRTATKVGVKMSQTNALRNPPLSPFTLSITKKNLSCSAPPHRSVSIKVSHRLFQYISECLTFPSLSLTAP